MGHAASKSAKSASAAVPRAPKPPERPEQLLANLTKLGQVAVDSPMVLQKTHAQMTHIVRTRAQSENTTLTNKLDAYALSHLYDMAKDVKNPDTLAQQFKLDPQTTRRLLQRYNSPSIGRTNQITLKDGEIRVYKEAIWV
ncbi:SubName: Full=Uncharacterized protein {ECO:0000313/EMBL:CCA66917.1} [Serendipita indica DSM 11827]|nr:SubName: Full=Uncharacterized protein {ECO:0000313/EMBL:CCA66917.1} [Serendipita indica DSM 11827]